MPRTIIAVCALLGFTFLHLSLGQTPQPRSFEVASVKPHQGDISHVEFSTAGARLSVEAYTIVDLVREAYDLKSYQVSWKADPHRLVTRYDIVARGRDGDAPTKDDFRQMLRSLLLDRFKLRVHPEIHEMRVYELVVGKKGLKLKPSPTRAKSGYLDLKVVGRNYQLTMEKATMDDVVRAISNAFVDRPILDKTGLGGLYELNLTYTPDILSNRREQSADDVNIFTAVEEQLGLKLESAEDAVDVLVIDDAQEPGEN